MDGQQASSLISNIVAIVLLLGVLVTVGWIVFRSVKSQSDLGENFVQYFQQQELFWLAIIIFLLMIGEAGFVATFHPQNELDYIPFGPRFIGHLGINLAGYVATINAPKKWYEFFYMIPPLFGGEKARLAHKDKLKNLDVNSIKIIMLLVYAIVSTIISFSLPIINVIILANGLDQMEQFKLMIRDIFYSMEDYYAMLPREYLVSATKLSPDVEFAGRGYSPFQDMRYPLQIVIAMVFIHYPIALMKGIAGIMNKAVHIFHQSLRGTTPSNRSNSGRSDAEAQETITLLKGAKKLLKFYGYTGGALDKKIEDVNSKIGSLPASAQAALSSNLAIAVAKLDRLMGNSFQGTTKKAAKADIKSFFGRASRTGAGFGMTLSNSLIDGDDDSDDDDDDV